MKVLGGLMGGLGSVPERVAQLEAKGYDRAVTAETSSDPFFHKAPNAQQRRDGGLTRLTISDDTKR